YLMLAGNLVAGWQLGRSLLVALTPEAQAQDAAFMQAKVATARFYAEHILVKAGATRDAIVGGAASVTALPLEAF
ncbi:acyl-CoA dehydrogenase C-terminal domain-containing protein, partial [Pseudacidovorax intermedius]